MSARHLSLARGEKAMRPKSSMHGGKKSDSPIVAMKPANKTASTVAEPAEPRGGAKGNAVEQSTPRTQSRTSVSHALDRIRQAARERPKERLTALYHHVTIDLLHAAYAALRREAAAGVDGVTWSTYGENLEANLQSLHHRVHGGAYRAQPSRRRYIPKPDGKTRPLGIASLEDKIVQKAVVEILNAIYEEEFLGFSYGFRPGRGQHDALDALAVGLTKQSVGWATHAPPDRQMAEGRCIGRRPDNESGGWDPARGGDLTAAGEHLPPLRLRPLGATLATARGPRQADDHPLRGRHRCRFPASGRRQALSRRHASPAGAICASSPCGENSSDRVRQICCRASSRAGRETAGDLQLSRVHPRLRGAKRWRTPAVQVQPARPHARDAAGHP